MAVTAVAVAVTAAAVAITVAAVAITVAAVAITVAAVAITVAAVAITAAVMAAAAAAAAAALTAQTSQQASASAFSAVPSREMYCDFDVPTAVYGDFVAAVDEAGDPTTEAQEWEDEEAALRDVPEDERPGLLGRRLTRLEQGCRHIGGSRRP